MHLKVFGAMTLLLQQGGINQRGGRGRVILGPCILFSNN